MYHCKFKYKYAYKRISDPVYQQLKDHLGFYKI
jgi:hypothetical protein